MSEHYVTVTPGALDEDADWRDRPTVKFECRGNRDSDCHSYPDCDCEYWDEDHEREHAHVKHDECWMQAFFESEAGHVYNGPDAYDMDDSGIPRDMERSGFITSAYDIDGFVEWEFAA